MNRAYLNMVCLLPLLVLLGSCDRKTESKTPVKIDNSFTKELASKPLGESGYTLHVPTTYLVRENKGPDFSVYYFYPADTAAKASFSGGFYFGNHPSIFDKAGDSCTVEQVNSKILGEGAEWVVYKCGSNYSVQTIVESKGGEAWNQVIHAFGNAETKDDMQKLLHIFGTLNPGKSEFSKY